MATKKTVSTSKKAEAAPKAAPAKATVVSTTAVRNSPVPKSAGPKVAAKKEYSNDDVARRAYFIWQSGNGGSEYDNWVRAENELRSL